MPAIYIRQTFGIHAQEIIPLSVYKYLNISAIKSFTVKLLPLNENFICSNFISVKSKTTMK